MGSWHMTQGAHLGALGQPRGMGWGGKWKRGSGGRKHVRLEARLPYHDLRAMTSSP